MNLKEFQKICIFFLAFTISGTLCESWFKNNTQRCSTECAITGMNKLRFTPSKTYIYSYVGSSSVKVNGIQDANTDMMWSAKLHLSVLTPCDVAVHIKDPELMGHQANVEWKKQISEYPIVASISEGLAQDVCTHPDDHPMSINIKKGLVSAFQNSLPSFSPVYSGRIFNEVDIAGECPTLYTIESGYSKTLVTKRKDHKQCENPYEKSAIDSVLLKMKLPLNESISECKQEIKDGIIRSVHCQEINMFKPLLAVSKLIEATQHSRIEFLSETRLEPFDFVDDYKRMSLMYEYIRSPPSPSLVPAARKSLKALCRSVDGAVKESAAREMADIIDLLKSVPAKSLKMFLDEIRTGQICDDAERFEELYLDMMAFVDQEGAIEIMAEEISSKNSSFVRSLLYAYSFFNHKHTTSETMRPLLHLISSRLSPFYMKLLAGNLVHEYCSEHPTCALNEDLVEIFRVLERVLQSSCFGSEDDAQKRNEALLALKIIGNMGVSDQSLQDAIFSCTKNFEVDGAIRGATLESFRRFSCSKQRNKNFKSIILDDLESTEIRIGAYLQYMRCPDVDELQSILWNLRNDPNQEYLVYIATHIQNIQETDLPYKQNLRDLLSNVVISENFIPSYSNFSRNIDLGFYSEKFDIGAEGDGSLIYESDSIIPRKITSNFTLDILSNIINIEDFGIRLKNIEPLWQLLQGKSKYVPSFSPKLLKAFDFLTRKSVSSSEVINSLIQLLNPNEKQHNSTINNDFVSRIDAYARFFGIETAFTSLALKISNSTLDDIFKEIEAEMNKVIDTFKDSFFNTTKTLHLGNELYMPTSNGIPLRLKMTSTSVLGMNFSPKSSHRDPKDKSITFHETVLPSFSTESFLSVIYDLGAETGIKSMVGLYSSDIVIDITKHENDIRLHLDIPGRAELIKAQSETYLMRKFPGETQEKLYPRSFVDPRLQGSSCSSILDSILPFEVCWKYDVTDVFKSKIFPFGKASILEVFIQSKISSLTGVQAMAAWKYQKPVRSVKVKLKPTGNFDGTGTEIELVHGDDHFFIDFFGGMDEEIRRSLKIQLESHKSKYGHTKEFSVFAGNKKAMSSNDKILHMLYGGGLRGQLAKFHYEFLTLNKFKDYLDANVEVTGEIDTSDNGSYRPLGLSFPKFEVRLGSGKLQGESFVRKVSSGRKSEEYKFLSKITKKNEDLYHIEGHTAIKGSVADRDFVLASNTKGNFGKNHQYESRFDLVHNNKLSKYHFEMKNLVKKLNILLLSFSHSRESHRNLHYKTKGQIEVNDYTPKYVIEGDITETGLHQYNLDYTLYEDDVAKVDINGPYSTYVTPEETKQYANISVGGFKGGVMNLELLYLMKHLKTKFMLEISRGKEVFTNVKYKFERSQDDSSKLKTEVFIKECIDLNLSSENDDDKDSIDMYIILYPRTNLQRILKGFATLNKLQKSLEAKVFYDLGERPGDNVHLRTSYGGSLHEKKLTFKGFFAYYYKYYHFETEAQWGYPTRHFLIDVTKPSKEHFRLESLYEIDRVDQEKGDVTTLLDVWTFGGKHFKWDSNVCYLIDFEDYKKITVHGKIHLLTPWFKEITIEVETDSNQEEHLYELLSKVGVSSKHSTRGLNSHLSLNIHREPNQKPSRLSWEEMDFHFSVDGILDSHRIQSLGFAIKKERKGPFNLHLGRDQKNIIRCSLSQFNKGKWILDLEGPSHSIMRAISAISTPQDSFTLFPNNALFYKYWYTKPDSLLNTIVYDESQLTKKGNLPRMLDTNGNATFLTSLSVKKTSMTGALDVNTDNKTEKISMSIERLELANGNFQTELIFRSRALNTIPRVLVQTTYTKLVKSINVKFKHEVSSPVTVEVSGTLEQMPSNLVFYGSTKTPQNQFELAATVRPLMSSKCVGGIFNSSIYSASFGMYDVASAFCHPGFVSLSIGSRQQKDAYVGKLGYRNTNAIASLEEVPSNGTSLNYLVLPTSSQPFLKASASLWKQNIMSVETSYESNKLGFFFNDRLRRGIDVAIVLGGTLTQDLIEEIFEKSFTPDVNSLQNEIKVIINKISSEVDKVFEDLRHEKFLPNFEDWKERIIRKFEGAIKHYSEMMDYFKTTLEKYYHSFFKILNGAFDKVNNLVKWSLNYAAKELKKVMDTISSVINGKISFKKLWNLLSITKIWQWVEQKMDKLVKEFETEVKMIEMAVQEIISLIRDEIKLLWEKFGIVPIFEDVLKWIHDWLNGTSSLPDLLHKLFVLQLEETDGIIRAQIPLRRPVYSIEAALRNIGLPQPNSIDALESHLIKTNEFAAEMIMKNGTIQLLRSKFPITEVSPPYDMVNYATSLPLNHTFFIIDSNDLLISFKKSNDSTETDIHTKNGIKVMLLVRGDDIIIRCGTIYQNLLPGDSYTYVSGLVITHIKPYEISVVTDSFNVLFNRGQIYASIKDWVIGDDTKGLLAMPNLKQKDNGNILIPREIIVE